MALRQRHALCLHVWRRLSLPERVSCIQNGGDVCRHATEEDGWMLTLPAGGEVARKGGRFLWPLPPVL
jgi:hypothetical protein